MTYRLASTEMVYTPNIVKFCIAGYFGSGKKTMIKIMRAWPVPVPAIKKLLSKATLWTIGENDSVVFDA
jgi:hypothetical protein